MTSPRAGRPAELNEEELLLLDDLVDAGAAASGFPNDLSDSRRVASVIRSHFGVSYHRPDTGGRVVDESYYFDGEHLSEYDKTKWRAHYEVAVPMMKAGLPLVIVQPGVNYGPGDTSAIRGVIRQYLQGKLPMVPDKTAYCWAHVDDTARGHLQAMEKGRVGESYIIAGPVHSLADALQMGERITGIKAPRMKAPPAMLRAMSAMVGVLEKILPMPEQYSSETLRVSAGATYLGNSAKAERELGFTARPLEEGLRETLAYEMRMLGL